MSSVDSLLPYIRPNFERAPIESMRSAINRAAERFCDESLSFLVMLDDQALVDHVPEYELEIPVGFRLVQPMDAWAAGVKLIGKGVKELSDLFPGWRTQEGNFGVVPPFSREAGPAAYFTSVTFGFIRIIPVPVQVQPDDVLTVRAALAPSLNATSTTVPTELLTRWHQALIDGAHHYLYSMVGQTWSDPNRAREYEGRLLMAAGKGRVEDAHGKVVADVVVRPRAFGRHYSW